MLSETLASVPEPEGFCGETGYLSEIKISTPASYCNVYIYYFIKKHLSSSPEEEEFFHFCKAFFAGLDTTAKTPGLRKRS